jgi:large subunit ribosomal protein L20
LLKAAKGYRGARSKHYRVAKETLRRAWRYSWIHRRRKKREFRRLWIVRLNAAVRMRGMNYSRFMAGLKRGEVALNRKVLAELAVADPVGFDSVVALAKSHL